MLKDIPPTDFLEVGVGMGDFLRVLGKRGFTGLGIDLSEDSVTISRAVVKAYGFPGIDIRRDDMMSVDWAFNTVFAFEVLEHFEDDAAAFRKIFDLLTPGGHFIMSVPAHQSAWGPNDDLAGHIRRYEKPELWQKLERAGFSVVSFWSAGYPVGNIFKMLRDRMERRAAETMVGRSARDRTTDSGVVKVVQAPDRLYNMLFNRFTLMPALLLQRLFLSSDLGHSYVVKSRKPGGAA